MNPELADTKVKVGMIAYKNNYCGTRSKWKITTVHPNGKFDAIPLENTTRDLEICPPYMVDGFETNGV